MDLAQTATRKLFDVVILPRYRGLILIGIMTEIDSMEKRHKQEIRDLEGKVRALLKTAKKSTKAAVEAEAIQMGYDLKTRQKEEYELISSMEGVFKFA